ncbi:MAG: hypothetical protein ACR2PG_17765 [Hyphomicrobiaceae bacterium]
MRLESGSYFRLPPPFIHDVMFVAMNPTPFYKNQMERETTRQEDVSARTIPLGLNWTVLARPLSVAFKPLFRTYYSETIECNQLYMRLTI